LKEKLKVESQKLLGSELKSFNQMWSSQASPSSNQPSAVKVLLFEKLICFRILYHFTIS